jgi:hypothetical protein
MKLAFHDQLADELKYAGCDLQALLLKGDPQIKPSAEEPWPAPGAPGAPGVPPARAAADKPPPEPAVTDAPPASLPPEGVPPKEPISVPRRAAQPAGPAQPQRHGILFYVDNTRCSRPTQVFLDGKRVGEAGATARIGFQTTPGPHDVCLLDDAKKTCGAPGTVRRSYIHEGWTLSLRCE